MSYSSEVLADSPYVYLRLNETSGTTAADTSGHSRNGSYLGSPTLGVAGLVPSSIDKAAQFASASSQYVVVPDDNGLDGLTAFTVEAWIKPSTVSGVQAISGRDGTTANRSFQFRLNGNKLEFIRIPGTTVTAVSAATLSAGTVYHVAAVYNGTDIRLYINGALNGTPPACTGTMGTSVEDLRVAAQRNSTPVTTAYFNGVVDEFAAYTTALSATRIAAHYTAGTTPSGSFAATLPRLGASLSGSYADPPGNVIVYLSIPAGRVASTLTGFPVRVDLADMSDEWWADTTSDLGNVRVRAAGTAIPFDIVTYDRTAKTGELWFKTTLTNSSANPFTVETVTGATALPATEPNGRNGVWSDYAVAAIPGVEAINRRDGAAFTVNGTPPIIGPVSKSPTIIAHDGITSNGTYWYANDDSSIHKYDASWNLVATNSDPDAGTGVTLTSMSDTCVVGSELFCSLGGTSGHYVVVYDAADLSFKRIYDITATGWAPAGLCFNAADGYFYSVGFQTGTNVATLIQKWDSSFNLVGTITTTSLTNKQGIEVWDGYFWVTRSSTLVRVNLDGSGAVVASGLSLDRNVAQGLTVHDGTLYVLLSDSTGTNANVHRLEYPGVEHYHFQGNYLRATGLAKFTDWTIGCTAYMAAAMVATRSFLSYSSNDGVDANRETLLASMSGNNYGLTNTTDGGVADPTVTPLSQDRYRFNGVHQTGVGRAVWRDGVSRATSVGAAARPAGTDGALALFIGTEDTTSGSPHAGSLTRIYLRNGVLSSDWLAAEFASWESPSSFYVLETPTAGTFAATSPVPTASFSGTYSGPISGSFAATMPVPSVDFEGTYAPPTISGSFAAVMPTPVITFAGEGGSKLGSFAVTTPMPVVSFAGTYSGPFPTDTSNALDGLDITFTGTATVTKAPAPVPPTLVLGERYEVAIPYPQPTMVNGRPT